MSDIETIEKKKIADMIEKRRVYEVMMAEMAESEVAQKNEKPKQKNEKPKKGKGGKSPKTAQTEPPIVDENTCFDVRDEFYEAEAESYVDSLNLMHPRMLELENEEVLIKK